MKITMNDSRITTIAQLRTFLKGNQGVDLSLRDAGIDEKYQLINKTVKKFEYWKLSKRQKRPVLSYLKKLTGYRKPYLVSLIKQSLWGKLKRQEYCRAKPHRIYTAPDIKLLERTDELHRRLSEKATQEILRREVEIFHRQKYQTIAKISHAHITNLRHHPIYKNDWINHTKARQIPIGITRKPENYGKPGSIRVDTVHQRDVYHVNSVDEITQWEIVVCVPQISERCMEPALQLLLDQYPFMIFNFHSDRGGEAINHIVANLLQKLLIKQTKSRARKPNDNALVETKNGSVIRKNMGWEHIHQEMADEVNEYFINFFNPYLNYHRPCGYPTMKQNEKGKITKVYDVYKTPYEALKAISGASGFLKPSLRKSKNDSEIKG